MLTEQRCEDEISGAPAVSAPLAVICNYNELQAALRARVDVMNISRRTLDHLTGLTDGYSEKLLGPAQMRTLGRKSLGKILSVLGLKLVLIEDPDAPAMNAPQRVNCQVRWKGQQDDEQQQIAHQ